MHHAGTADSVPSLEFKIVHNTGFRMALEREPVSPAPRTRSSALRNRVFDSTRRRARARLRGHPGAGGGHLDIETLFLGRPSASRRRPFCLAPELPAQRRMRRVASQGTLFMAGELRSSRRQQSKRQWTALMGRLRSRSTNAENRPASIPVAAVIFQQIPRTDTQRRNDQRYHQKCG